MNQTRSTRSDERVLRDFRQALDGWRGALEAHRLAPPDHNFGVRLAGLAEAAREQARACRDADVAGFDWTPHRAAESRPPYELQPGTGRRGPEDLWRRFDAAAASLSAVATGTDILAVADAYEQLGAAAIALAEAVAVGDRGARAPRRPARARASQ
jgi:hypothetical protein